MRPYVERYYSKRVVRYSEVCEEMEGLYTRSISSCRRVDGKPDDEARQNAR